jgi:hypothetical protein
VSADDAGRYTAAHGTISLSLDAPNANRLLLAIERLDQLGGIDPALADLRERLKRALVLKSSGDTDSAPSSGE